VTNSDGRIFGADGGAVMRQLAGNNPLFLNTCNNLLERMINSVPANVRLSDPITPIPVKPVDVALQITDDGSLQFSGNIRLAGFPVSSSAQVRLHYLGSQSTGPRIPLLSGPNPDAGIISTTTNPGQAGSGFDTNLQFFSFNAKIPIATGLESFWVEIQDGSASRNDTNGGGNFPMSDTIITENTRSCVSSKNQQLKVVVAVRQNAAIDSVTASFTQPVNQPGIVLPRLATNTFTLSKTTALGTPAQGYDLYEGSTKFVPLKLSARATFDIIGSRGGLQVASNDFNIADLLPDCP